MFTPSGNQVSIHTAPAVGPPASGQAGIPARDDAQPAGLPVAAALVGMLAACAACWILTIHLMRGMDMGVSTKLGSFSFFVPAWASMMAAMMLPGAVPAVLRRTQANATAGAPYVIAYLTVWTAVGVGAYAVYRPHGTVAAGLVAIAAGLYELTPLKRHFRQRCLTASRSGTVFGFDCVGSSVMLMGMLLMFGAMSITWMIVIAGLVFTQKLLPVKAAIDVPLALLILAFGVLVIASPSSIPGLVPPAHPMPAM